MMWALGKNREGWDPFDEICLKGIWKIFTDLMAIIRNREGSFQYSAIADDNIEQELVSLSLCTPVLIIYETSNY